MCRNCCIGTKVKVNNNDIKLWKEKQRYDILLCLETFFGNDVWLMHKKNDECIFLTEKGCEIYEFRPKVCKDFPKSKWQKEEFNCKLL